MTDSIRSPLDEGKDPGRIGAIDYRGWHIRTDSFLAKPRGDNIAVGTVWYYVLLFDLAVALLDLGTKLINWLVD